MSGNPMEIARSDDRGEPAGLALGEERLRKATSELKERVESHLLDFSDGLEGSLTGPIRDAFRAARTEHDRLMQEAGLHESADGSTPPLEWARLRTYREGIRSEVLEPLRSTLEALEVGTRTALRWEGFQNGMPGVLEGVPAEVLRGEPADLYHPRPGDGPWLRSRKALVRTGRRLKGAWRTFAGLPAKVLGRSPPPEPPRSQLVPLKSLAQHCLLEHCPLALEPFAEAVHQHYAILLSNLASGVVEWAREWYPAEEVTHSAEDHMSPSTRRQLTSALSRLREEGTDAAAADQEADGSVSEQGETDTGIPAPGLEDTGPLAPGGSDPRTVARALQKILAEGAEMGSPVKALRRMGDAMEGEWARFMEQIRVAGSFQADKDETRSGARVRRLDDRLRARGARWSEWHSANLQRMKLPLALMRVREGWDRAEDQLLGSLADDSVLPILSPLVQAGEALRELRGKAEERLSPRVMQDDPKKAATIVEELLHRTRAVLEEGLLGPMTEAKAVRNANDRIEATVGILSDTLRSTPVLLTLCPSREDPDRVEPTVEFRKVPLRENLLKIVDVVRLEAIRNSPAPVLEILENARNGHEKIPEIASFNLSSAHEELSAPPDADAGSEPNRGDTRELVTEGLERTADAIHGLLSDLPPAWDVFLLDTHGFFAESFRELHGRSLVEGFVQEQIMDFRSRLESRVRTWLEAIRSGNQAFSRTSSKLMRRLRIRGLHLARLGRSAVGMDQHLAGEAERALEILRDSPRLLESLPLVYRKLFSFQPVSDPTLLVGREDALDWLNRRFQAWKDGAGTPCVIQGGVGTGHTSLLNVATQLLFDESSVIRLTLDFRPGGEAEVAGWLVEKLGLDDDEIRTFDQLGKKLTAGNATSRPRVVLLESLEHLFLRVTGGTDLLEDFLTLQARTSESVFWLSTSSMAAWKYLTRTEPATAAMASTFTLSLPSRESLAELILTRHQRSGLALEFLESPTLGPLVRRKLRRARGEKARQAILREEFFDRLHRMADGSVAMAILFWLHALDFGNSKGKVRVSPPRTVRFAFLEELDLTLDFALMALLEHGTLTIGEFTRVFQVSREDAWQIFEVLRARMLVEPGDAGNSLPRAVQTINDDVRYRIPPLLGQVVAQRLKNRNILH